MKHDVNIHTVDTEKTYNFVLGSYSDRAPPDLEIRPGVVKVCVDTVSIALCISIIMYHTFPFQSIDLFLISYI